MKKRLSEFWQKFASKLVMFLIKQFILVNGHFTIKLLAALVCFAVAWLYYDAWSGRRDTREGTKALGFLLLCLSFVVQSTKIEQSLLETSLMGAQIANILVAVFKISAYLVLIIGQVIDPLQPLPEYRVRELVKAALIFGSIPPGQLLTFSYPILAVVTAFMYLRRATAGLEHHLKPISWSLFILSASEVLSLTSVFRRTDNIFISNLVAPYGPLWLLENALVVVFFLVLGKWIWGYLIRRLETQLLMIFTTTTLGIFLVTTMFFTTASLNNLKEGTIENLKINVNVLSYSIESKRAEALSDAQVIAQNPTVLSAVLEKDRIRLTEITTSILLAKKQTFLVVVAETGKILVRADDPEKVGGSLSDDPLVRRALESEEVTGVVTKEGVMAPQVSVRAATPIKGAEGIIGAVVVGTAIDNAFLDGLKSATGLEASVYADNIRSATTFIAPDGKSRWVGIKEETEEVKKKVLVEGELYTGSVNILNIPYLTAFIPLEDVSANPVGMLFVGTPQVTLFQAASRSIELTFLVTAGLLVLSVIPAYFVSRYIIEQIH
jgi:hypothetical protein